MTAPKTNERPGTRATLRQFPMSASKARVVLDLVRGEDVQSAREILAGTSREAARVVGKVLASAVANAVNNDGLAAEELYVSACYADEGVTAKRFSPRARGRAGRIRKRTCHITVIVSRLDDEALERLRAERSSQAVATRARRVASSRRRERPAREVEPAEVDEVVEPVETGAPESGEVESSEVESDEVESDVVESDEVESDEVESDEVESDEVESDEVDETVAEATEESH
ncbi:MAG: 50S ribosomal protein L22 [Actinobacteria bacterium 21-73-9]|nr:MAG: 50S ribosomal protein L22 [Actinobacteria bacterium 21-73-9]